MVLSFCLNVRSTTPPVYFSASYDPSTSWNNEANSYDVSVSTYAVTSSYANDQWLEIVFSSTSTADGCVLSNKININVGFYKVGGGATAQKVDIELSYVESKTATVFAWNSFKTDQSYNYATSYDLTMSSLQFLNGVRIRAKDDTSSYNFRVFNLQAYVYTPSSATYMSSSNFFDRKEEYENETELCNNWVNTTVSGDLDFSDYVSASPIDYFNVSGSTTSTSYDCGDNTTLTHFQNFINCTGTLEHVYSSITGWKVWANVTGTKTPLYHTEKNTTYSLIDNSTGYWITTESKITQYLNLINATGTHEKLWTGSFWKDWANVTGNDTGGGGDCNKIVYYNYSDDNITLNLTVNCTSEGTISNYTINDDNWLKIAGFSVETGELGLFIVFVLFSLAFVVDQQSERSTIWKPILLFMDVPISLATGVFYLGNTLFSVDWWIGVIMFTFAILLSMGGLYYSLKFGRK